LADHMEKKDLPTWLVDLVNYDEMFESVEECVNHLEKMNSGKIAIDDRWIKVD